jgi:enamine deaminase RidA (YjgF/YER057c/UK114 family)
MERLLRAADASLGDVVKVGGWLTFPMGGYGPLGEVRSRLLTRHGLLPASGAVQVGRVSGEDEPLLSFEAIAFAPRGGSGSKDGPGAARGPDGAHGPGAARRPGAAHGPDAKHGPDAEQRELPPWPSGLAKPSPLAAYYATAREAGGYVFTCGEIPRVRAGARQQADDVYEQLGSHLGEHGASPSDVVHQTVFVRSREDIPVLKSAASAFCGARTPTTFIPAADMGFRPGVDVEIELIARPSSGTWGRRC